MANHKRGRAKNRRAGCLLCKPHKANGAKDKDKASVKRKLQFEEALEHVLKVHGNVLKRLAESDTEKEDVDEPEDEHGND